MKPSVRQVLASQAPASSTESTAKTGIEFIPAVFFVLGILLAASVLQGISV